ncbi:MAG: glycosyl transferase family 1, partial [Verrucomicrobia bacterium RIFCSPLOWO2_12_FULL_64_8]
LPEPGPMLAMMLLQFLPSCRPRHLVLTFHGSEILRFHRRSVTRRLTRRLIDHAARLSVLSGYSRDLLCRCFPSAASKVVVTPGAVRSELAASPAIRPPASPSERLVILTVARLHPRKGQLAVIEALQSLPAEPRGRIEYRLVGSHQKKKYEQRLRATAARSGFTVRFLGDVADDVLHRCYAQADIFALTSMEHGDSVEGFGLVYLEAGAHGLPVVAHAIGGVPEAVTDGVTGLLVPPGDRPALAGAFARLINDPELRRRLGAAGQARARQTDWSRSAELLFDQFAAGTPA